MEQIVEAINEEQVDLVCIAGDLFDSSYEGVRNPERIAELMGNIKSNYGHKYRLIRNGKGGG